MIEFDLSGVFDEMLAQMQGDDQRKKVDEAFRATPEELAKAAVEQAKK